MNKKIYPFKREPRDHQLKCWDMAKDEDEFAKFMDMGTGKSKVLIDNICYLYDNDKIDAALICSFKGTYADWITDHLPKDMPDHIAYKVLLWDSSKAANKGFKAKFEDICRPCDELRILVMNTEGLSSKGPIEAAYRFVSGSRTMMAVDESTMIKNHKAKRTIAATNIGRQAMYRRIMTGRPIVQNPLDVFAQVEFLGHHLLGFASYYSFRSRYALLEDQYVSRDRIVKKVVGFQRIDELIENLKDFSFQIYKKDCLDLPDKVYETVRVNLTKEQKDLYEQMLALATTEYQNEVLTATNALSVLLRIHQITCGIFPVPDGENKLLDNEKMSALMSTIDEMSGKIIIWAGYKDNIRNIVQTLRKEFGDETVGDYYGDTSQVLRRENIERFQNPDDSMRFFVGSPQTGAFGITLTAASNVIYYSNTFNLEHRLQSEDRAHRIGQTNKVTYVDIITSNTVDEQILGALMNKKKLSDLVLDCLGT